MYRTPSFLIILFLITGLTSVLTAQFSPGDLAKAHARYEGTENCTQCHEIGKKLSNSKCLDCHKEIGALVQSGKGYHSSAEVKGKECKSCHSDHNGRNYKMIKFDPKKFDHKKTGYTLSGAHASLDCEKCHTVQFILNPELKKRKSTYLGLPVKCLSCHENKHAPSLGDDCGLCHNEEKFSPAPKFEHNKAKYKLTGAHQKVECSLCHYREGKEVRQGVKMMKLKGLKYDECSSCHKDVHEGRLGKDCESCHSTASFHQVKTKNFDHNKTKYPLFGKHQSVDCKKCHTSGDLTKALKFSGCIDCHKDYHRGEFTVAGKVSDCNGCHTINGFTPSQFTLEQHNQGKFQLKGAHLSVACVECHKTSADWNFKIKKSICIDCHQNVHGNTISAKYFGNNNCTGCHTQDIWTIIAFDHTKTEFPLIGKHTEVSCVTCHVTEQSPMRKYSFAGISKLCVSCHEDIHRGQFIEGENNECSRCHTTLQWKIEKFNHEKTNFPLKGAHEKVPCGKCHKTVEMNNSTTVRFKIQDTRCITCHS